MENPIGLRKVYANIIRRCITRIMTRNKVWDMVQSQGFSESPDIRKITVVNNDTLLGNTRETTPVLYHYYIYQENMWYFFDIRELIYQFKLEFNCNNPYTNKKLSSYIKYRAIRHYYKITPQKEFTELVWETPSYTAYQQCISALNAQLSQFNISCDMERLNENILYTLIHQLITWDKRYIKPAALQFLPLLNLNFLSGNAKSYRALCYLFLSYIIECQSTRDDKYEMALKVVSRADYCSTEYSYDPLSPTLSQFLNQFVELDGRFNIVPWTSLPGDTDDDLGNVDSNDNDQDNDANAPDIDTDDLLDQL